MALYVHSVKLPTGDTPICDVTLEPFVLLKRGEATLSTHDVPDEGPTNGAIFQRHRWYRSSASKGTYMCSVHPDREATTQCVMCTRLRVQPHLSYHCSPDCLKNNWSVHKDLHKRGAANGQEMSPLKSAHSQSLVDAWIEVGKGRTYTPTLDDVSHILKYEYTVVDKIHPYNDAAKTQSAVTTAVRPAPNPPLRALFPINPTAPATGKFTVCTYNLLADLYAKSEQSKNTPAWLLCWQYRKRNLLRELLAYKADILCLQEVQSDHYSEFWAPELQKAGYVPIYKRKSVEVITSDYRYVIDGCATFFNRERFSLVKKYEVEFNKAALSLAETIVNQTNKKQALTRLLKDNVALIAVLESVEADASGRRPLICVANTHIHANPELADVKIWQVHTLLKGLEKIAASADIPMLVAGDFNSIPGSPAHTLLVSGKVDHSTLDPIFDPLNFLKDQKLAHSLRLSSAYSSLLELKPGAEHRLEKQRSRMDARTQEPCFTHINKDFKATLDYLLYTRESLAVTALLELPSEAEVLTRPDELLPNAVYSSDHIALMAEFTYVH